MKTSILVIGIIIAIVISSVVTAIIVPKEILPLYPEWLEKNIQAAHKINDSEIPIIGVDVDRQLSVLTIYMTDENSNKYNQAINNLIDVPFEILTETESRELQCLQLYKDIRELSRSPEMSTAERDALKHQKQFVNEYVETKCPYFPDLEFMYDGLKSIPSDEFGND